MGHIAWYRLPAPDLPLAARRCFALLLLYPPNEYDQGPVDGKRNTDDQNAALHIPRRLELLAVDHHIVCLGRGAPGMAKEACCGTLHR